VKLPGPPGEAGGEVEFTVEDEGEGIPEDKIDRVFERFFRVDGGRVREKGVTGLGLSIVKHLVQLHEGRVWAKNGLQKGTRIILNFPSKKP